MEPYIREETPFTSARLKNLISIYAIYGGYIPDFDDPGAPPQNMDSVVHVGDVTKVDIKQPRDGSERRELNSKTFDQIKEMIPGLTKLEVRFSSIMTYKQNFLEACGVGGFNPSKQTRPMAFMLVLPSPIPTEVPARTLILSGCWFGDNPIDFDVTQTSDMKITQDVNIHCARITEVKG